MHGAPGGACRPLRRAGSHRAKGSHTGLRGARGTPLPNPVLGAQGRGLRAQGSGLGTPPSDGAMGASSRKAGPSHLLPLFPRRALCQASLHPTAPQWELPQGPGRLQGRPHGCTHSRRLYHLGSPE